MLYWVCERLIGKNFRPNLVEEKNFNELKQQIANDL